MSGYKCGCFARSLEICTLHDAAPLMLEALEKICAEAESWHTMHGHTPDSVQCDAICELIPEMKRAILKAKMHVGACG